MALMFGYGVSLLIGVALGLLGGGGGILTVPTLHYLFEMEAGLATASSLFVVGITSMVGAARAACYKELDFRRGILFALPGFVSVGLARRFVVPAIPETFHAFGLQFSRSFVLMFLFAGVMFFSAMAMLKRGSILASVEKTSEQRGSQTRTIVMQGFLVGAVTGLVGAGGGFLIVPALTILVGLPMKTAIGTSLFVIALNSTVGVISSFAGGVSFEWKTLAIVTTLSLIGMLLGQRLKQRISDKSLKKSFAWFVLSMAIFISVKEVLWLFKH